MVPYTSPSRSSQDDDDNSQNSSVSSSSYERKLTRPRRIATRLAELSAFISIIFAIVVMIGSTHNKPGLTDIYFIRLDFSHIIPKSAPNAVLINSVAQSLGLRDFYQVGLWGWCEGYKSEGTTYCSTPKRLFWFNPVQILTSQLLAGATIALPPALGTVLNVIRIVSHVIFISTITGTVCMTVSLILGWTVVKSRWYSGIVGIFSFVGALLFFTAASGSTVMFIAFRAVFESNYVEFSIGAYLGVSMFVCMWINAISGLINFILQSSLCCCGISERKMARKVIANREKEERWMEMGRQEMIRRGIENGSSHYSSDPMSPGLEQAVKPPLTGYPKPEYPGIAVTSDYTPMNSRRNTPPGFI